MPTPEEHALLSASSSYRWLNCPPSARLVAQFPETTSTHAEVGRVAHAIAELKARKHFLEPMSTRTFNARMKKLREDPHYDKGMEYSTDAYLDYLKELAMSFGAAAPFVALETRVDYADYAPEGFGTSDCIMIGAGRLCVIDYKNGAGVPVDACENSQMMLYALGALKVYAPIFGSSIREIHLAIVQPNAGGVKEWGCTRETLEEWGDSIKPTAALAFAGEGEFCAGAWCDKGFCPARAQCSARARMMLELEPMKGAIPAGSLSDEDMLRYEEADSDVPPLLTDTQVGGVLARGRALVAWVKDLEEYALGAALAGREITGFKVVEGRGSRDWNDMDAAFRDLVAIQGVPEALLWERKPVSVAGLEKALGKAEFARVAAGHVVKKPGKPALVPESDPRKPYNAAEAAFGVVSENGN